MFKRIQSRGRSFMGFKPFSSIYGQVILIIALLSAFLFISFSTIFRTVNQEYMESTIKQNGNNVGMFVEGALYQHMLENDRTALRNTLDLINEMPGIEDVNLYDAQKNLVYSSFTNDSVPHSNPNCKSCHAGVNLMFPEKEKSFRILNMDSKCSMSQKNYNYRLLLINSPILNQRSCYTAACHAHNPGEAVLGSFVIRIPLEEMDANLQKSMMLAGSTAIFLVIFLMIFTRKKIKKPLMTIISASEAVARGDRSTRLDINPGQLADMRMVSLAFNNMLDNLQAATHELQNWSHQLEYKVQKKTEELSDIQNELVHVERIACLGRLSSSVAHEINNPLAGVLTYTKLVQKQLRKLDVPEADKAHMLKYLKVIEDETKRCGEIVKGLLDFSRKDQADFEIHHLHRILNDTYNLMEHQMKIAEISFRLDLSATHDLVFCGDNQVKQACIALLLNSSEAVGQNGEITIRTLNPDAESIRFEITDNGTGISAEDLPHIFEPFFSTKGKTKGLGLGLAIVHGIIQNHKGKIDVSSEPGKGTVISVTLPLMQKNE